jgi:hypothetical protein
MPFTVEADLEEYMDDFREHLKVCESSHLPQFQALEKTAPYRIKDFMP